MDTEFWKKLAYTAVGYALINPETVREITDKFMAAGKMTEAEGESFMNEIVRKGQDMRTELDKRIHDISTEVLTRMNVATQDDMKAIRERLDALEAKAGK